MTLSGPKRAFGKGERREQNAVIKVYSVAELKVALTKVYGLPNGVGTIQIAGDITISEPIKLKQFVYPETGPREIIIQSVGGARIYNGSRVASNYNYNAPLNTNIPVFDFGTGYGVDAQLVTRYTFKDIQVNSFASPSFGAFIAADLNSPLATMGVSILGIINISNIKLNNVWNLFAAYDTSGAFTGDIVAVGARVDSVLVRNTDADIISFSYNNTYFATGYGVISNISVWNLYERELLASNLFSISTSENFVYNTFQGIGLKTEIVPDPLGAGGFPQGYGNTFYGGEVVAAQANDSFAFINSKVSGTGAINIFPATTGDTSFNIVSPAQQTGSRTDLDFLVDSKYSVYRQGGSQIVVTDLPDDGEWEINWHVTVRRRTTDETNTYHIKTNYRKTAGTGVIVSNNTIAASEEFLGLIGLFPSPDPPFIQPTLGAEELDVDAVIHITGRGISSSVF